MDSRLSLTLKQLIAIVFVTAVLAGGFVLVSYYLGQKSGALLSRGGGEAEDNSQLASPTQTMPPLPRAMTATPVISESQSIVLGDDEVTESAREFMANSDSLMRVAEVSFSESGIRLNGEIDAMGYQGPLDIEGVPYVEDRQIRFRVTGMQLDGEVLPQFMYPLVEAEMNAVFDELTFGYDVQTVEVKQGEMLITLQAW